METIIHNKLNCYHCGTSCNNHTINFDDKHFCCDGCKTVYSILNENNLCTYYSLNNHPSLTAIKPIRKDKFDFLDNASIQKNLIRFANENETQVQFYLPQIHCSSCLWLLENLHQIKKGIISCTVHFVQKEVFIRFNQNEISFKNVVETLASIGYEPHLSLQNVNAKKIQSTNKERIIKLGVAGFCFSNIMMLSFPEYLNGGKLFETNIQNVLQYVSIVLSLPVLFYASSEFFTSAFKALKNKYINLDAPVALAIALTFGRSLYEIITHTGSGYLDSMAGIVFFMLIGRWVQEQTYKTIAYDRDYKSFFPIAVDVYKNNQWISTSIQELKENDIVKIYTEDIIPFDGILSKGYALVDYSFVTGESIPSTINIGDLVYAGGKQKGESIELLVVKPVSQSYLTNLWNNEVFSYKPQPKANYTDIWGKYFTYAVLGIAAIAATYWFYAGNIQAMLNAITTVLIVACPCALLLASNYTNGSVIKIFNANKFYIRDASVIDQLASINHLVYDKTGTITTAQANDIMYYGKPLTPNQKLIIASVLQHSNHPLSKAIVSYLNLDDFCAISSYKNHTGKGIEAWANDIHVKIGSAAFVGERVHNNASLVCIKFDNQLIGYYEFKNTYLPKVLQSIKDLTAHYETTIISGDNDNEQSFLNKELPKTTLHFNQSPMQKLQFIQLYKNHTKMLMIGDGLNDAGALKAATVGIAVSNGNNTFTPASDAVVSNAQLHLLGSFLKLSKKSKQIITLTFIVSALYNIVGLWFAIQGTLQPVIAAILMPLSSLTIIALTYLLTHYTAKKLQLQTQLNN